MEKNVFNHSVLKFKKPLDIIKPVTNSSLHPWKSIKPGDDTSL